MKMIFPPLKNHPRFQLDLSIAYVGILILGVSIASTEMLKIYPENKIGILQVRLIHTGFLFLLVFLTHKILIKFNVNKLTYFGLCALGLWVALLSLIVRVTLMDFYGFIPDSQVLQYFLKHSIPNLGQAFFWIPLVIILGGQRTAIFDAFKNYEKRLVSSARQTFRKSEAFLQTKNQIDTYYRKELNKNADNFLASLVSCNSKNLNLEQRNELVQSHLQINSLREFSRWLNVKSEFVENKSKLNMELRSLNLISKQFNILHNVISRKAPLRPWIYTLISFMLIMPNYVLFFSITEILLSMPPLFVAIHFISIQIHRILLGGSKFAVLQSNLLIIFIGYLPLIENKITRSFYDLGESNFPFVIVGVFYPLGYFVYMRFIQIIQPRAVLAINDNEIYASSSLKTSIQGIVNNEFEQSMSHQWATFIHGKILTRLAATSLKLEQAVSNNDLESFELSLQNLSQVLEDPTKDFDLANLKLEDEVGSRLNPWEGLISIKVKIDPDLQNIANDRVRDLGEVIEEVISNSVRHGSSQNIAISITRSSHPDIYIEIEDDALKPLPLGPSRIGLGTKILNLVTDGRWSISHVEGKTTVNLTMSLLDERNL